MNPDDVDSGVTWGGGLDSPPPGNLRNYGDMPEADYSAYEVEDYE